MAESLLKPRREDPISTNTYLVLIYPVTTTMPKLSSQAVQILNSGHRGVKEVPCHPKIVKHLNKEDHLHNSRQPLQCSSLKISLRERRRHLKSTCIGNSRDREVQRLNKKMLLL